MALSKSVASELLEAFRAGEGVDLIRESVRLVMQDLIEAETSEVVGADRYERSDRRVTERNGSRPRLGATQAGDVELRIPKLRQGSFFPVILERRRRIDQGPVCGSDGGPGQRGLHPGGRRPGSRAGLGLGISKSEVSRICAGLDEQVEAFRARPLHHTTFPYVFLDATYLHVRRNRSRRRASHVDGGRGGHRGYRQRRQEILGVDVGDSEDEVFWRGFLRTLRERGLAGVQLVIPTSMLAWSPHSVGSSKEPGINGAGSTLPGTCSP